MVVDTLVLLLLCLCPSRLCSIGHGRLRQPHLSQSDRSPQGNVFFAISNVVSAPDHPITNRSSNRESVTPSFPCTPFSYCWAYSSIVSALHPSSSAIIHRRIISTW